MQTFTTNTFTMHANTPNNTLKTENNTEYYAVYILYTHICMVVRTTFIGKKERIYECLPHEYLKHMRMAEKTYVLSMLYLIC